MYEKLYSVYSKFTKTANYALANLLQKQKMNTLKASNLRLGRGKKSCGHDFLSPATQVPRFWVFIFCHCCKVTSRVRGKRWLFSKLCFEKSFWIDTLANLLLSHYNINN